MAKTETLICYLNIKESKQERVSVYSYWTIGNKTLKKSAFNLRTFQMCRV